MISDNVMVALIRESISSASPPRRTAARVILDEIRTDPQFELTPAKAEMVRADEGPEVADEVRALVERLGL